MRESRRNKILNWAIIVVIIANIAVFSSFSSILISQISKTQPSMGEVLRVATTANPATMDPIDAWDSVSNNMLDQVVETLIAYDLSDPNLPLVGRLTESWYWPNNKTIVFQLRENVFFHDGSRFTADCVLHTIKRINYFGNWSGTLPSTETMAFPHSLYKFRDGTPIFNDTLSFTTDDYNVTLVLNRPYTPAEGLLAYTASSILHPDSTPADQMLELGTDLVVGTGPFRLIRYVPNKDIIFARWERYWRTGAYWDQIVYTFYRNADEANNAMLNLDVDYLGQGLSSYKQDFIDHPDITVTGDGVHDYIAGSIYCYIGFNTEWINLTWRKAICHAFNYTYLIKDILEGTGVKANSLVPSGFPAHNSSVMGGTYNVPYARQIMQSMGYGYTAGVPWDVGTQVGDDFYPGANETLWHYASFVPPIGNFSGTWDFSRICGSTFQTKLFLRFAEDMYLIGIKMTPQVCPWDQFLLKPNRRHIWFEGWGPDYFETFDMIDPLVNPASESNYGKINNTEINTILAITQAETDTSQRYEYYKKLQYLIHDKYYYHIPLFYNKVDFVHAKSLKGFPYNCMRILYWYPTYHEI
ncbi:MAG: ABC transporter substrate-binding protein [Candidatus Odinarchaeota archaeon]